MVGPGPSTPPPAAAALVGVLLVGGESRRFGTPKQLAPWRGRTLGEQVAAALAAVAGEVVLAGAGEVAPALVALARAADAAGVRGPIAGLLGACAARPGRALLAAACDQPLLDAAALAWLAGERRAGTVATLARLPGARGVEPLPGVYEPEVRPLLAAFAATGGSLQPLAARADVRIVTPPPELALAWASADDSAALARLAAAAPADL
jgi:molybdopterin-guanine dinucleotide biosynthesis protein A